MKNQKKIVAVIPVKEKSDRVPNKNFRPFNSRGESLLDITVNKLTKLSSIDHIYISTDKSELNLNEGSKISIIKRDKMFCNNVVPWSDVINNVINSIPEDDESVVMWCHTTAPLFDFYEEALIKFLQLDHINFNSLVVVEKLKEFIIDEKGMPWNYMYGIWHKYSQDLPNLYKVAGSLFINKLSEMKKTKYVINSNPYLFEIDSKFSIDIDNEWEFELAQILYKHLYQS